MVFPSRACKTCKKRRVKCDNIRPSCGRCAKAKYNCSWDAKEDELLPFRSENAFASGKPRRQRREKDRSLSPVTVVLSPSLEAMCLNYWVQNFAFEPLQNSFDLGIEYGSEVVSRLNQARQGSSLQLALYAVAHAVFGRAKRAREAIQKAKCMYSAVISMIQKDIQAVADEDIDQLLLALMLLGGLERHMPRCPLQTGTGNSKDISVVGSRFWGYASHHKGATGILKLRILRNPTTCSPLDSVVRRQITQTLILSGRAAPSWFYGDSNETCPAKNLDLLMLRTTNLRASSLFLVETANRDSLTGCCHVAMSALQDIIKEALKLEDDFSAWTNSLPNEWQYTVARPTSTSHAETDLALESLVHTYSSHHHCAAWSNYRAARLIVNDIALRAFVLTESQPIQYSDLEARKKLYGNVYILASDLCGGIRSMFGDLTTANEQDIPPKLASLLAWPLTIAFGINSVPYSQKAWLSLKLKTVIDVLGDEMLRSIIDDGGFKF